MPDAMTTIIGNVTRDPELKFLSSGQALAKIGVAVSRKWERDGEKHEQTSFFDVTCWGPFGENVAESVSKGTRVVVTGRLEQRSWENDAGEKRSAVELVADALGPDLRFATVNVNKNERTKPAKESNLPPEEMPF